MTDNVYIGSFDQVVDIYAPHVEYDAANVRKVTYEYRRSIFAAVTPFVADETVVDYNEQSQVTLDVVTYDYGITRNDVLKWQGDMYDVVSVRKIPRRMHMNIRCTKRMER